MAILKKIGILSFLFVLFLSACGKDVRVENDTNTSPIPETVVNASLAGVVTDEAGKAISNALITVGDHNTMTDANGVFTLNNITIKEDGALVSIKKAGYFDGFKMVNATENRRSNTRVILRTKDLLGTMTSNSTISVKTTEGAEILIPDSSLELETGGSYEGQVNIYGTWFDPTDNETMVSMPGDLRAINSENELQQLQTYGMIGVELETADGRSLQITEGKSATIRLPIPSSISVDAPATIPLWHFDENTGYWMEEGQARLEGNEYVGEVSHFSFWNCDFPYPLINFKGSILDSDMQPLTDVLVAITITGGVTGSGHTDESGMFGGKMPKDQVLTLKVINECWGLAHSEEIGPFSEDVILDPIIIEGSNNTMTVRGSLENCDAEAVEFGYVIVDYETGYRTIFVEEDGTFSAAVLVCNVGTISVSGVDLTSDTQGNYVDYEVSASGEIDLGVVSACENELERYLYYRFNSEEINIIQNVYISVFPDTSLTGYWFLMSKTPEAPLNLLGNLNIEFVDFTDVNTPSWFDFRGFLDDGTLTTVSCQNQACDGVEVIFEEYGTTSGDVIKGSFSGSVQDNSGVLVEVEGEFKAPIL